MPVQTCTLNGKPGYRWGESGKCYTYTAGDDSARKEAKRKAHIQGAAAEAHGAKAIATDWIDDPELWQEVRGILLPVIEPLFTEAFIVGAEMGAMQRPARERLSERMDDGFALGLRQLDPDARTVLPYDFEATLLAADDIVAAYSDEWWAQFSQSTQRMLRQTIARAERLGLTSADVAAELAPIFGPERAKRIAVSELTDLMGQGAQETYRRAGFRQWEWRTVNDARVDQECKSLDRKRFPMSTKFRRAHVNCRCWCVPYGRPAVQPFLFAA